MNEDNANQMDVNEDEEVITKNIKKLKQKRKLII